MSLDDEQPTTAASEALRELAAFPLVEALYGRRSRRFALGGEIPDGPLAYRSKQQPLPLTELERMLVLSAMGGTTGWHYSITRHAGYAPHISNYAGGAAGRTFPSAAGFHTAELFFTDDSGVYFFPTRDAGALVDRPARRSPPVDGRTAPGATPEAFGRRLHLPRKSPTLRTQHWCVNVPVAARHTLRRHRPALSRSSASSSKRLCGLRRRQRPKDPGARRVQRSIDVEEPFPLTFSEQYALTEATAELATACYAGVLMLQAMGLGGWMFDGIDRFSMLGASGNPEVPGLGFRFEEDERWATPNPTGRENVFEAYCPPHYPDMAAAVEAFAERKFGPGGPFNREHSRCLDRQPRVARKRPCARRRVPSLRHSPGPYILDTFGKFPAPCRRSSS